MWSYKIIFVELIEDENISSAYKQITINVYLLFIY